MGIGRNVIIAGIIAVAAIVGAFVVTTYFTSHHYNHLLHSRL
jgi:hypothetical protein